MSYFSELPKGNVRISAAGKIMGAPQANSVIEAGCDYAIMGRSPATISPNA